MKLSHLATVTILALSAIGSAGAIGLVAREFAIERTAVQVVADTAIVERLQGVSDAIDHVPPEQQQGMLAAYGFAQKMSLDEALSAQRSTLDRAQQARAVELSANDKRLTVLLALCGFNAIVAVMGAIALHENTISRRRRAVGAAA